MGQRWMFYQPCLSNKRNTCFGQYPHWCHLGNQFVKVTASDTLSLSRFSNSILGQKIFEILRLT
uniref:Uncharacterized protein n=1 Tax=Nelumbo nucifera TaxID=4432 RepID=A0A822YXQ7_NELNU|nr:TPA_asm: hypothetical protein HUJ06_007968 [Nelumbo nucifera]